MKKLIIMLCLSFLFFVSSINHVSAYSVTLPINEPYVGDNGGYVAVKDSSGTIYIYKYYFYGIDSSNFFTGVTVASNYIEFSVQKYNTSTSTGIFTIQRYASTNNKWINVKEMNFTANGLTTQTFRDSWSSGSINCYSSGGNVYVVSSLKNDLNINWNMPIADGTVNNYIKWVYQSTNDIYNFLDNNKNKFDPWDIRVEDVTSSSWISDPYSFEATKGHTYNFYFYPKQDIGLPFEIGQKVAFYLRIDTKNTISPSTESYFFKYYDWNDFIDINIYKIYKPPENSSQYGFVSDKVEISDFSYFTFTATNVVGGHITIDDYNLYTYSDSVIPVVKNILTSINGSINTPGVSENDSANSNLTSSINNFDSYENNATGNMTNSLTNISTDIDLFSNSDFIKTGKWVSTQVQTIYENDVMGLIATFSLVIGLALALIGFRINNK